MKKLCLVNKNYNICHVYKNKKFILCLRSCAVWCVSSPMDVNIVNINILIKPFIKKINETWNKNFVVLFLKRKPANFKVHC